MRKQVQDEIGLSRVKRELLSRLLKEEGIDGEMPTDSSLSSDRSRCGLSFAQERIWFFEQLEPGTTVYNVPLAVRLQGGLQLFALEQGLNEVFRRHNSLRAKFTILDGQPVQWISEAENLALPVVDLSNLSDEQQRVFALRLSAENAGRSFDLGTDTLLRTYLLKLKENDHVLLAAFHHIATDGWSMAIFNSEILALYKYFGGGSNSELKELDYQYTDFVRWQRDWLKGERLQYHIRYWKTKLDGAPPFLELPTDRPRPSVSSSNGDACFHIFSSEVTSQIKDLSRRESATPFMTLLAIFKALLYYYCWKEDVIVGTPIANRNHLNTERIIGFFVNSLVLRTSLAGNPTFSELIRRVREVTFEAYDHQDLPFDKLVDALRVTRELNRHPLFQIFFAFNNNPKQSSEFPGLKSTPLAAGRYLAKFDIEMSIVEENGCLVPTCIYNSDIFDAATIGRLLLDYERLAKQIVTEPDRRVLEVSLSTRNRNPVNGHHFSDGKKSKFAFEG